MICACARRFLVAWGLSFVLLVVLVGCACRRDSVVGVWRVDYRRMAEADGAPTAEASQAESNVDRALGPQLHWLVLSPDGVGRYVDSSGAVVSFDDVIPRVLAAGLRPPPKRPLIVFRWRDTAAGAITDLEGRRYEGVLVDDRLYVRDQDQPWGGWNRWIFRRDSDAPAAVCAHVATAHDPAGACR